MTLKKPIYLFLIFFILGHISAAKFVKVGEGPKEKEDNNADHKTIKQLMFKRYTAKSFAEGEKVDPKDLKLILEAGTVAPADKDIFPFELHVFTDSKSGQELSGLLWRKHMICGSHCDKEGNLIPQYFRSVKTAAVNILVVGNYSSLKKFRKSKIRDSIPNNTDLMSLANRDAMMSVMAMVLQGEQLGYKSSFVTVIEKADELYKKIYPEAQLKDNNRYFLQDDRYFMFLLSFGRPDKPLTPEDLASLDKGPFPELKYDCRGELSTFLDAEWITDGNVRGVIDRRDFGKRNRVLRKELVKYL